MLSAVRAQQWVGSITGTVKDQNHTGEAQTRWLIPDFIQPLDPIKLKAPLESVVVVPGRLLRMQQRNNSTTYCVTVLVLHCAVMPSHPLLRPHGGRA